MSNYTGFTVDASSAEGGLASSALPGAPVVAEPERVVRLGVRSAAASALRGLAGRIEPSRSAEAGTDSLAA